MKSLKKLLEKYLKKNLKTELACNNGDADLIESISENVFLEDVTGDSFLMIDQDQLCFEIEENNRKYSVFVFSQLPYNLPKYLRRYGIKHSSNRSKK